MHLLKDSGLFSCGRSTVFLVASAIMCIGLSAPVASVTATPEALSAGKIPLNEMQKLHPAVLSSTTPHGRVDGRQAWPALWTDILLLLLSSPTPKSDERPTISAKLKMLIASRQPQSGDVLLSVIAEHNHSLHRRATNAFVQCWDTMNARQINAYFQGNIRFTEKPRKRYPQGVDAVIGMGYSVAYGWGGWPVSSKPEFKPEGFKTWTAHFVDGVEYGKPFAYYGPMAGTYGLRTKRLSPGTHTVGSVLKYEFSLDGVKHTGWIKSPAFSFDIIASPTTDDLLAPPNTEIDALVRSSFQVAETFADLDTQSITRGRSDADTSRGWKPQVTWNGPAIKSGGLHLPVWKVTSKLPIDLCFDVEIQDVQTGEIFKGDSVIVRRGEISEGHFMPRLPWEFARDLSEFVPVRIFLKPSRALALTYADVEQYYAGSITTGVLRAKVSR